MINLDDYASKRPWPSLRCCLSIYLEGLSILRLSNKIDDLWVKNRIKDLRNKCQDFKQVE